MPRIINPIKIGITVPLKLLETINPKTLDTAVVKKPYNALAVPALSPCVSIAMAEKFAPNIPKQPNVKANNGRNINNCSPIKQHINKFTKERKTNESVLHGLFYAFQFYQQFES